MDAAVAVILRTAYLQPLTEPNAEAGFDRIRLLSGSSLSNSALAEAVSTSIAEGLIRDPVTLPPGALQCHWRLALTPKGVEAACALSQNGTE